MKYLVVKNADGERELIKFLEPLAEKYKARKIKEAEQALVEKKQIIADNIEFRKHISEFIAMFPEFNEKIIAEEN